jgi:nitrate reductase NapE component
MTVAVTSHIPGPRSLIDTALAAVVGLWSGVALLGPGAFVGYLAVLYGPAGLGSHFQATLDTLAGLGDFGAFLAWWLQLLTGG